MKKIKYLLSVFLILSLLVTGCEKDVSEKGFVIERTVQEEVAEEKNNELEEKVIEAIESEVKNNIDNSEDNDSGNDGVNVVINDEGRINISGLDREDNSSTNLEADSNVNTGWPTANDENDNNSINVNTNEEGNLDTNILPEINEDDIVTNIPEVKTDDVEAWMAFKNQTMSDFYNSLIELNPIFEEYEIIVDMYFENNREDYMVIDSSLLNPTSFYDFEIVDTVTENMIFLDGYGALYKVLEVGDNVIVEKMNETINMKQLEKLFD